MNNTSFMEVARRQVNIMEGENYKDDKEMEEMNKNQTYNNNSSPMVNNTKARGVQ